VKLSRDPALGEYFSIDFYGSGDIFGGQWFPSRFPFAVDRFGAIKTLGILGFCAYTVVICHFETSSRYEAQWI
jgi:hypothetical protein